MYIIYSVHYLITQKTMKTLRTLHSKHTRLAKDIQKRYTTGKYTRDPSLSTSARHTSHAKNTGFSVGVNPKNSSHSIKPSASIAIPSQSTSSMIPFNSISPSNSIKDSTLLMNNTTYMHPTIKGISLFFIE